MNDQAEALRQLVRQRANAELQKHTRFISVASGKGGVGKSNFSLNFALALQRLGKKVLLLDADIGMANIDVLMGLSTKYNLYHLIKNEKTIWDIISLGPQGLHYIAGGSGLIDLVRLSEKEIVRFADEISKLQGQYDFVIFDTGAGLSKETAQFITASDETIVVTTPEPTSITDAYALIKMVNSFENNQVFQLIVNRCMDAEEGYQTSEKLSSVASKFIGITIPLLGIIQDDHQVTKAVKKQTPMIMLYPESAASKAITQIARKYLAMPQTSETSGVKGFIHRLFKRTR